MKAIILTLLLMVAGLGLLGLGTSNLVQGLASKGWTEVEARVEKADLGKTRKKGGSYRYHAHITYTYTVHGVPYTSRQVGLTGQGSGTESQAQKLLRDYAAGKTVKAYHHPAQPENAVLIRGVGSSVYVLFVVGFVFLGMGSYIIMRGVRAAPKPAVPAATA